LPESLRNCCLPRSGSETCFSDALVWRFLQPAAQWCSVKVSLASKGCTSVTLFPHPAAATKLQPSFTRRSGSPDILPRSGTGHPCFAGCEVGVRRWHAETRPAERLGGHRPCYVCAHSARYVWRRSDHAEQRPSLGARKRPERRSGGQRRRASDSLQPRPIRSRQQLLRTRDGAHACRRHTIGTWPRTTSPSFLADLRLMPVLGVAPPSLSLPIEHLKPKRTRQAAAGRQRALPVCTLRGRDRPAVGDMLSGRPP